MRRLIRRNKNPFRPRIWPPVTRVPVQEYYSLGARHPSSRACCFNQTSATHVFLFLVGPLLCLYLNMITRDLLSGPVTLSAARANSRNVLQALGYPRQRDDFYQRIEGHRALLADVVAHHLGASPSDILISTQEYWRHGSFNLCIPVRVNCEDLAVPIASPFVMLRFPLPYRVGEKPNPGNCDEKVNCEAATYAWIRQDCPSVPIPRLYGFGLSSNQRVSTCFQSIIAKLTTCLNFLHS